MEHEPDITPWRVPELSPERIDEIYTSAKHRVMQRSRKRKVIKRTIATSCFLLVAVLSGVFSYQFTFSAKVADLRDLLKKDIEQNLILEQSQEREFDTKEMFYEARL